MQFIDRELPGLEYVIHNLQTLTAKIDNLQRYIETTLFQSEKVPTFLILILNYCKGLDMVHGIGPTY